MRLTLGGLAVPRCWNLSLPPGAARRKGEEQVSSNSSGRDKVSTGDLRLDHRAFPQSEPCSGCWATHCRQKERIAVRIFLQCYVSIERGSRIFRPAATGWAKQFPLGLTGIANWPAIPSRFSAGFAGMYVLP